MTRDEIYAKVKDVLTDSLGVDDDEVTPDAVLRDDLGAESIDYLDIQFRLEKTFGIKIEKGEMFSPELATDPNFVQGGNITPAGIEELKKRMPFAKVEILESDPKLDNMAKLFTVDMITNFVEAKLNK
ncbi:MAG TPA: acyl carrier protein [Tepidisphaeraceae bacterium]|mgnify:CR=1 FL=1|nr:acyl carrier protein [Tepidisphaeraceae bacterium]